MTTALLVLGQAAVDEHSTAYNIGRVVGTVIVIALILGGIYLLGTKLLGSGAKKGEVPAGWYDDPAGGAGKRWWDGKRWTERRDEPGGDERV